MNASSPATTTPMREILDLARWAPSGDNTQPWRFAVRGPDAVDVLAYDTREHCVYDLDGHASQISVGALLETMSLAATRYGLATDTERDPAAPETAPVFHVRFRPDTAIGEDPLVRWITERRVQRRPLRTQPLARAERHALETAAPQGYRLRVFGTRRERMRFARLNFESAKIRLTIPEAFEVHRAIIEWGATHSEDRVPSRALGAGRPTLALMRWGMRSWPRVRMLNRFFAGTVLPRVELDLVPGLACAAHWALLAPSAPGTIDEYVAAGRATQRVWLTCTSLGLQCQPEYTPLVFARYAREERRFAQNAAALRRAQKVAARLDQLLGPADARCAVFMARVGHGTPAHSRSLRLPLDQLMQGGDEAPAGPR